LENIKGSLEYQENAETNPDHFLVRQVKEMIHLAPGLLKYEGLRRKYREDRLKVAELE
jgi:hypothetical protein